MSVVFIALPVALLLALGGIVAFIWAVRGGQMDDLETPGMRMLVDDDADRRKPVSGDKPDLRESDGERR